MEVAGGVGQEHDGKAYLTWDEAIAFEESTLKPNGWRLPTKDEWIKIADEFGMKNGSLDAPTLMEALNMELNGTFHTSGFVDGGASGYWWSSSAQSAQYAYSLRIVGSTVNPANGNGKYFGFTVRCVLQ